MDDNVIFRYKDGRIIPIKLNKNMTTNDFMNDKIRSDANSKKNKEFNDNFYMQDGDFYEEWKKGNASQEFNSVYNWGEEKRINVYDKKTNKQVAYLKYKEVKDYSKTDMKDKINVVTITVDKNYRRKGIATQLYKELQKRAGNNDIHFGELSDEGKKLVKSIGKITKKNDKHNDYWGRINL